MSAESELLRQRFERLLRWYPRRWRAQHGDVMLSTLLDEAERAGRSKPTPGEGGAAALHGIAARLDIRSALTLGSIGLVGSLVSTAASIWGSFGADPSLLLRLVLNGISPALVFIAVVALARGRAVLSDGRALVLAVIAGAANILGALASLSWGLAFRAADDGVAVTGLAAAWTPLILAGLVLTVIGVGLFAHAVLRRTGLGEAASSGLAALIAVVSAPLLGYALVTPFSTTLLAAAVVIGSVLASRSGATPAVPATTAVASAWMAGLERPMVAEVRLLAIVSTIGGVVGLAWAFTGSLWSPFGGDSTQTMREGIAILCASTLPLLTAFALRVGSRSLVRWAHTWGPATLAAAGFGVLALDYIVGDGAGDFTFGMTSAGALVGIGIGWFAAARTRLTGWLAVAIGATIAATYAVSFGPIMTAYLAFLSPFAAITLAVFAGRNPDRVRSRPPLTPELG